MLCVYSVDVSAAKDCVVFSLDADGNSSLDKYIADNPGAEQAPVRDVLDESTLRAFGNYNQDSQWIALCSAPVKAYHPTKGRHCVDRYPYDDNSKPGKWACQMLDARLDSKWSRGNWNDEGEFIPYDKPCDKEKCANRIDQATIDILTQ